MNRAEVVLTLVSAGRSVIDAEAAVAGIEAAAIEGAPVANSGSGFPTTAELLAVGVGLTAEEIAARVARHREG
jgi:hypothetical protein